MCIFIIPTLYALFIRKKQELHETSHHRPLTINCYYNIIFFLMLIYKKIAILNLRRCKCFNKKAVTIIRYNLILSF